MPILFKNSSNVKPGIGISLAEVFNISLILLCKLVSKSQRFFSICPSVKKIKIQLPTWEKKVYQTYKLFSSICPFFVAGKHMPVILKFLYLILKHVEYTLLQLVK